jgi:hypothetical protein
VIEIHGFADDVGSRDVVAMIMPVRGIVGNSLWSGGFSQIALDKRFVTSLTDTAWNE